MAITGSIDICRAKVYKHIGKRRAKVYKHLYLWVGVLNANQRKYGNHLGYLGRKSVSNMCCQEEVTEIDDFLMEVIDVGYKAEQVDGCVYKMTTPSGKVYIDHYEMLWMLLPA